MKSFRVGYLPVLIALLAVGVVWLWLVTYGTWELAHEEWLSGTYDSLARSLVRGEVTVEENAIMWEGVKVGDRMVAYQSPFPAVLRILPSRLRPDMVAKWSRLSCLLAALLAAGAFLGLAWRATGRNASLTPRRRSALVGWSLLGFGLGSPVVYLVSCARLYHEAILWGLAWGLVGVWSAWELAQEGDIPAPALIGLGVGTAGALLSRLTFGLSLLLVVAIIALGRWRDLGAGDPPVRRRRLLSLVAAGTVLAAALAFAGWYNQARFGSIWKTFNYAGFYLNPARMGGEFNWRRLPSGVASHLGFFPSYLIPEPPFIRMVPPWIGAPAFFVGFKEEAISLPVAASWLVVGALLGSGWVWRRRSRLETAVALVFLAQACFILGFYFITQRYQAEILPFLVFAYATFLSRAPSAPRKSWWVAWALPVLVGASAFASVASTLHWHMRLGGDTPRSYKILLAGLLAPPPSVGPWAGQRVFLSDLTTVDAGATFAPMGLDASFDGNLLSVGSVLFGKGLGMHAVSAATYEVPRGAQAIEAVVGVAAKSLGTEAAVRFVVKDDTGKLLFDSGIVRAADSPRPFRVALGQARTVTLQLDDGGNGIDHDHGTWGAAAFLLP